MKPFYGTIPTMMTGKAECQLKKSLVVAVAAIGLAASGSFAAPAARDGGLTVPRRKPLTARVGVLSVGLDTYWKQFPGVREELVAKCDDFESKLRSNGVETVRFALVDCPQTARAELPKVMAADLDVLFVDMVTYGTSSVFAPFVRELNIPIVLVALQIDAPKDFGRSDIREILVTDDICALPEYTGVARRFGKPVADCIVGPRYGDPETDEQIRQWCACARVLHDLKRARIGLMGHVLEAMYDMQTDPTAVSSAFGCHVTLCEPDEMLEDFRRPDPAAVDAMKRRILGFFDTPDPASDPVTEKLRPEDLEVAAKAAVALENFVNRRDLDGLAYYYEGEAGSATRELVSNLIVGNSLLIGAGFPMCGEFDLKNCIAMFIFDRLGIGGSFCELHPADYRRNSVLVGHDGPHHVNIASGRPVLRSLKKYHGKPGHGAGVEFSIKPGPVTILSIGVKEDGHFKLIIAEGTAMDWPIPPTGNTSTHVVFPGNVRHFLRNWAMEGPTHHFALGVGHHAAELLKLARVLKIEAVVVKE